MPYIGYNVTNAGSFALIDDIASTFNGSNTAFTLQVGGVNITPNVQNLLIAIDGVVQQAPDAYSVSGSTITFTGAPASGADFYGVLMGQSSYVENNSITADELAVSGDGTSLQVLTSDGDGTFSWVSQSALTPSANLVTGNTLKSTVTASSLTSVGTLTSLTVDDMTFNGSTISDAGAFDIDAGGVIKLDAGGGQIQFFDDGTEIGVLENSSSDFVIESKVQDKDILFKGNDGGTGIELMRMNMSGANVGISTGNSIGAKLHVADNRSTAYSSTGEPAETIIAHNKNGTDDSGVNNYASLAFAVADGATSQGFINYVRTGNNTGDFTFSQRTGGSSYAEALRISSDGKLGVGHTTPQFGLTLAQGDTDKEAIGWEDAGNTKRASIYTATSDDFLTFNVAGGDRMKLGSNTSNWTLQLTGNSPYGMQITTTASNSSSHDMFVVKRGDGTKCFEIFGDGNVYCENNIVTDTGLRTKATNGANPTGDFYNVAHKFATYRQTLTSSHITDGYVTFSNGIYRDNVLGVIANFFKVSGTGANNNYMGYQDAYITRADYYASNVARAYLGSSAEAGDYVYLTIIYHGNTG